MTILTNTFITLLLIFTDDYLRYSITIFLLILNSTTNNMLKLPKKHEIRQCSFQLQINEGTGNVKFPCSFFVEWKSINGKQTVASPNRYKLTKGKLAINEKLVLVVNMIYDRMAEHYLKKQSVILVNLISNSRPQDAKLVGRITVQLSSVVNSNQYQQLKTYPLEYCSVEGTLTFRAHLKQWTLTNMVISDLERSQLSQFEIISIQKSTNRQDTSEVDVSKNLTIHNRTNSKKDKLNQSGFQQRISKLRAQAQLMRLSKPTQGLTSSIESNEEQKMPNDQQQNFKVLQNNLSVPQLKSYKILQQAKASKNSKESLKIPIFPSMQEQKSSTESEKGNADQTNENLINILQQNQGEINNINNQLKQCQQQNSRLKVQIKEKTQKINQQLSKKNEIQKTINETTLRINQQQNQKIQRQKIIEENAKRFKKHENQSRQIQKIIKEKELRIIQQQSEIKELLKTIQDKDQKINQQQKEKEVIEKSINEKEQRINQQQNERRIISVTLKEKDLRIYQLQQNLLQLKQMNDITTLKMNQTMLECEKLQATIQLYSNQNKILVERVQQYEQDRKPYKQTKIIQNKTHINELIILEQKIRQLTEINKCLSANIGEKDSQIILLSNIVLKNQPQLPSDQDCRGHHQIRFQLEKIQHQLGAELNNHQNTKNELNQLREWYNQIQYLSEKVMRDNQQIKEKLQASKTNILQLQNELKKKLEQQQQTISQRQQMQVEIHRLQVQLISIKNTNLCLKEQLLTAKQAISTYQQQQKTLGRELQSTKKQLDQLEVKFIQQQQQLTQEKEKSRDMQLLLEGYEEKYAFIEHLLKQKEQQINSQLRKNTRMLKRLKEMDQNIDKLERQNKQFQSRSKELTHQYEQKIQSLLSKLSSHQQLIKKLENENIQTQKNFEQQINNQIQQVNRLRSIELQTFVGFKSKSVQGNLIKQLEETIRKYAERQKIIKQNLKLLEGQSNKLEHVLQSKEKSQLLLNNHIQTLNREINEAKARVSQLESQCQFYVERSQGLEAEIEILNAYQSQELTNEFSEINQKLIDKNTDLIRQLEQKNQLVADIQQQKGHLKGKQTQKQLQLLNSRIDKQRRLFDEKYYELVQQNERLSFELNQIHSNHKIQMQINAKINNQILQELNVKVQSLYTKNVQRQLQHKAKQLVMKEEKQKIQARLQQYEYQVQFMTNEITKLHDTIHNLNLQLENRLYQLQNTNSQIKNLQEKILQRSNEIAQIKRLSEIMQKNANLNVNVNINNQILQEMNRYKSKLQFYEFEIDQIRQKQFVQERKLLAFDEELNNYKENAEQQNSHIEYLEEQLKSFRQRQTEYIEQNEDLKDKINNLQIENIMLKQEIDELQNNQKSKEGTPINHLRQTPSIKKNIDFNKVVVEIIDILSCHQVQQDLENALRRVIYSCQKQYEKIQVWQKQRSTIQDMAKLALKEIQKIKQIIINQAIKSIIEKTELTDLLKPVELLINELLNVSETRAYMDIQNGQQEQQHHLQSFKHLIEQYQ